MNKIIYNQADVPVIYDVDTIVAGGGTAGSIAAIAVAKAGNTVVVLEKFLSLGGSATNALVSPMMPTNTERFEIGKEIIHRLEAQGCRTCDFKGTTYSWFHTELLASILENMLLEYHGNILYDADIIDVVMEEHKITYVIVNTIEGLVAIHGKTVVDASGDCIISRLTKKIKIQHGDEKHHYNQMSSLRFEMGGVHIEEFRTYLKSLNDDFNPMEVHDYIEAAMVEDRNFVLEPLFQKGLQDGVLKKEDLRYFQTFSVPGKPGVMTFNCPHLVHMTDNTKAIARSQGVMQGRAMIQRLVSFMKTYVPGFQDSFLLREAAMLGVRESFRIVGKYVLSEKDYAIQARFEDGIAKGDWYIDVHSHEELYHGKKFEKGEYYEIPYRTMVTNEVENLIVAGRTISTTFLMQASIRIQATVRDMGQIAGEACVYSLRHQINLNEIDGKVLRKF